jgi:hypothetical protein
MSMREKVVTKLLQNDCTNIISLNLICKCFVDFDECQIKISFDKKTKLIDIDLRNYHIVSLKG